MRGKKLTVKDARAKLESDVSYRKSIFKDLCQHLATGYSIDCFGPISEESILKYLKTYPEEFCQEELQEAMRNGKDYWEGLGNKQANGTCLGNSRTWYYNMAQRYGWRDKIDIKAEHSGQVSVNIVSYARTNQSTDTPEE